MDGFLDLWRDFYSGVDLEQALSCFASRQPVP
jgi:hypothetical protein